MASVAWTPDLVSELREMAAELRHRAEEAADPVRHGNLKATAAYCEKLAAELGERPRKRAV